ncbi:MAG TPA: hypothetical protein VJ818_07520 [Actinomycetota bacterium]|nr:hypothetical protein [Actinomycetota bacterium]
MNPFKSAGERRVEALTWGALLVWVGVSLIVDLHRGVPSLVAGSILLLSAIYQRFRGWEAGIILWAGGLALTLSGLNDLRAGHHHLSVLAIVLILIGGAIVLRAVGGESPRQRRRKRFLQAVQDQRDQFDRGPFRDI